MAAPKITINYTVKDNSRGAPPIDLLNDFNGEATLADVLRFIKGALIGISLDVLREEQAAGFDKDPVTIVDNRFNVPVQSVNPLGKIEFVARADGRELLLDVYKNLLQKSKVRSGSYLQAHLVSFNGKVVATSQSSLEAWLETAPAFQARDKIRFFNIQPYARKLETYGVAAGKASFPRSRKTKNTKRYPDGRVSVPSGAYKLTEVALKKRYKSAFIKYELIKGTDLGLNDTFKKMPYKGQPYLYPSILVYLFDNSLKR